MTRTQLDRHVLALAAVEGLAGNFALEVHDDEVAHRRGMLLRRIFPALALGRELLDLLIDRRLVSVDTQPLDRKIVDLRRRNVGKRFDANPDLGIAARLIFVVELDLRLQRGADILLG